METVLFNIFSAMCVGGGLAVLFVNGYVNAAMSMLISVLGFAGLVFLSEAYLLALLIIMVYAGAVMVLFVFTVMMMADDSTTNSSTKDKIKMALMWLLSCVMLSYFSPKAVEFYSKEGADIITSKQMSAVMFSEYMLHIQLIGLLLLVAMVAVIIIAKDSRKNDI